MIEVKVNGTAKIESEHATSGEDGRANFQTISVVRQTIDVEAIKTFEDGYVNLEAYALSERVVSERRVLDNVGFDDHPALDGWSVVADEIDIDVTMSGNEYDWLEQAIRYVSERPDMSISRALSMFAGWEGTDDYVKAANAVAESCNERLARTAVGGIDDEEYTEFLQALDEEAPNGLLKYAPA